MLGLSFVTDEGDAATLQQYAKLTTDNFYLGVAMRTFRLALLITLICLIIGFPARHHHQSCRTDSAGRVDHHGSPAVNDQMW